MALFPAGLLLLIQAQGGELQKGVFPAAALFVLIPEVLCVMGLLLWAAPIVYSEVEGKTWTYLALSPTGKAAILIGKYLTAVFWTALTAWLSLALCLLILRPEEQPWRLGVVLSVLGPLSKLSTLNQKTPVPRKACGVHFASGFWLHRTPTSTLVVVAFQTAVSSQLKP